MNLLLLDPGEVHADGRARLTGRRADHLRTVLRVAPGQAVRAGVVGGLRGTAIVESADARAVEIRVHCEEPPPPRPRVDLLLAVPRPKVLKRLWAQLAAVGVGRVFLANAAKVERMYFDTHVLDPVFFRDRLLEGLEQAGDTGLPEVSVHRRLKVLIEDDLALLCPDHIRLVADPANRTRIGDALRGVGERTRVLLAVGPEGGWTDHERALLARHGFAPVAAGARVLRTDTACIALLALVHDALGTPSRVPALRPADGRIAQ